MQAVKFALLGLLHESDSHGYDLKNAFEDLLGGAWTINIGQVYTTLARLERDGLVWSEVVPQDLVPDRRVYSLTDAGRAELLHWLKEPSEGPVRLKDELFVKMLVQSRVNGGNPRQLVAKQRERYLQTLAELGSLRSEAGLNATTKLIIDGAMLHVEADLKWLELCEERLGRGRRR